MALDHPMPTQDDDYRFRNLETNIDAAQRALDDILRKLQGFDPTLISGFNTGGDPTTFNVLAQQAGAWLGISEAPHALNVYDASTGSTPKIGVTPGAFNGSIIPTIGGNPINVQIGSPLAYPLLTCTAGDQVAYFSMTYNSSNVLTAVAILSATQAAFDALVAAVNLVPGTAGTDYFGLSSITAVAGPPATTSPLNDYVTGPQGYSQCGSTSQCWRK